MDVIHHIFVHYHRLINEFLAVELRLFGLRIGLSQVHA